MSGSGKAFEALCAELRACEETLLDPAVRRDRVRVAAMLAEGFEEFGSSGGVWTREQILELLAAESCEPATMEGFRCHWIAERVVLVTYRTVRTNRESGQNSAALRSSLWIHEDGVWRVRFHQGTRVP